MQPPLSTAELSTASGGAGWGRGGGREGGRLFLAPAKISEEASCSVIHPQGQGSFASQPEACRKRGLRVLTRVYMYTPRAVYGVHTRGHAVHAGAHAPLPSCTLRGCPAVPSLGLRAVAQLPEIQGSCRPARQCGWVRRGQDGPGAQPAPSAVRGAVLSPWGCTVLAEPVPWQERGSATSRAEPRTPVTSNAPGQGPNSPPARERHAGSEAGVGERRGDPVGRRHPEPDPCPQLAPLQR